MSLLEGLTPVLIGWMEIFGAWSAAVDTDGFVPDYVLRDFDHCGEKITAEQIEALVAAGKWSRVHRGIDIVGWADSQASDEDEEQFHEYLDEPAYNSVDAEAVQAIVSASKELDVHEVDNEAVIASEALVATGSGYSDDDDEGDVLPASELMAILEERPLDDFRETAESETENGFKHQLKYADEIEVDEVVISVGGDSKRETVKAKFEYTEAEFNDHYDEFLSIMMKRPEDKRVCWEWFCDDLADYGHDTLLDAADAYASSTGGKNRQSPRFEKRVLPEVWLEDDGVSKYLKRQKLSARN
jgi:hypothetical protein